jgi:hypothetical protein
MKLNFEVSNGGSATTESWEVFTDSLNNSYFYCEQSKSTASFRNTDTMFYFTGFSGDKKSLLYYFYLGAYKVLLSYFPDMEIDDKLTANDYYQGALKPLQDLIAPFYVFIKPVYRATFSEVDNVQSPGVVTIASSVTVGSERTEFEIIVSSNKIKSIRVKRNALWLSAENIG